MKLVKIILLIHINLLPLPNHIELVTDKNCPYYHLLFLEFVIFNRQLRISLAVAFLQGLLYPYGSSCGASP